MLDNTAETANHMADLIEQGLKLDGIVESHDYFLWQDDEQESVQACALGLAVAAKIGNAKGAHDNWMLDLVAHHEKYAANVLGISVAVCDRISIAHSEHQTTAEEIIQTLRNNPEIYFY